MRYPIFIPSKGRFDNNLTARLLLKNGIKFTLVVEDNEFESYEKEFGRECLLKLPGNNFGGVYFARNFIREFSESLGYKKHWQIDDDIGSINFINNGVKVEKDIGEIFTHAENILEKYENVGIAGFISDTWAKFQKKPFSLNTFAYTCFLVDNGVPVKWRAGVEDDLDFNLQCLDKGWCTFRFNIYMFRWAVTNTRKGGYTDIYASGAREKFADNMLKLWPFIPVKKGTVIGSKLDTTRIWKRFNNKLVVKKVL